jgi:hypothetical protein
MFSRNVDPVLEKGLTAWRPRGKDPTLRLGGIPRIEIGDREGAKAGTGTNRAGQGHAETETTTDRDKLRQRQAEAEPRRERCKHRQ